MCSCFRIISLLVMLGAVQAYAQSAPEVAPAGQEVSDNRSALLGIDRNTGYPVYYAPPQQTAQQPTSQAPVAPQSTPQPGDYGFSPIQDLRQLNF